jgi:hypothetical protein
MRSAPRQDRDRSLSSANRGDRTPYAPGRGGGSRPRSHGLQTGPPTASRGDGVDPWAVVVRRCCRWPVEARPCPEAIEFHIFPGSPSARRSATRLLAEVSVSGWSAPSTRRRRARVSSSSARAC